MTEQITRSVPRPDDSGHPDVVVSLGTDHHSFDRLVRWIDDYARRHRDLRFLVQHGHSTPPEVAAGTPFLSGEDLGERMREARVVVTHGGPGTIVQARHAGRLPIVVARDPELDEHVDDHQLLFVRRLEEAGRIRACSSPQQLSALIDRALASPDGFRVRPPDGDRGGANVRGGDRGGEPDGERRDDGAVRAALRAGELIDLLIDTQETVGEPKEPVAARAPETSDTSGVPEVSRATGAPVRASGKTMTDSTATETTTGTADTTDTGTDTGTGTGTRSVHAPVPDPAPPPDDGTRTWPEVTVVVPTRDRPELLRRTLRAIAEQDYPGRLTTIVVFDNDQPDPLLARSGGDRPVRVVTNTLTPGLAGARNTGVLAADSDLVAFCDDDDTWLPDKLRAQVRVMLDEPGTEMVCCGIRVVYDRVEAVRSLDRTRVTFGDLLGSRLTELHPSTFLIRRRAMIGGCGTVSEEIPGSYAEDYELLLRLARRGPIRNIPEPGVRVLWHRSSHFSGRWRTISTALRWLLDRYPEFALVPRGYARVAGQIAFAEAASGRRRAALRWIATTIRNRPAEGRAYLALMVVCGTPSGWITRALHLRGRGL
ncbi:glycosyltransferase [Nocardiopsis halotolerans]|uniref:glycosyltransferase n=1 Tax=Nocardiopsis halotolerans TaxID=124252 RepID=UPI000349C6BA|nr:glycosyltransferase [Nocardiopsis halotolerans]